MPFDALDTCEQLELAKADRRKVLAFALPLGRIVAAECPSNAETRVGREIVKSRQHLGDFVIPQDASFI